MQNSESLTIQTEHFRVFNKELDFVFLTIHGALHHWCRLKWLHDIYSYSKDPGLDWEKIMEISNEFSAGHLVRPALWLADHFWPLPDRVKQTDVFRNKRSHRYLISYPLKTIAAPHADSGIVGWQMQDIYQLTRYTFMLFPKALFRSRFLKGILFNEGDLNTVNLPDRFAFLYLFLRPVLLIYNKLLLIRNRPGQQDE